MKRTLAKWMIRYGLFLIACGVAGYASNPGKAATALISGGTFGTLSILWGWLMARGVAWSRWAAIATTSLLVVVFSWRASVSWVAILDGNSEKLFAACLITVMLAGSVVMLPALMRARKIP